MPSAATIIEVRDLHKSFDVPDHRADSLRELVIGRRGRRGGHTLKALDGVSFDVKAGEFFGIVGQNGSGKSTLLKILASIYRADRGRVRIGGRLAPFIELGVGFNPDLSAPENIEIGGVMMGLGRREARRRTDAVLDFAELQDFRELKVKNYSSGMMVRLAFALMVEAQADVMLIDEVLAVGDAAFAAKCMEVFRERRRRGQTVVLVTHDMDAVQALCHRAMMLDHGRMRHIGDSESAAREYFRANFAGYSVAGRDEAGVVPDINVRLISSELRDETGAAVQSLEQEQPLRLDAVVEARRPLGAAVMNLHVMNEDSVTIFSAGRDLAAAGQEVATGARIHLSGTIAHRLLPGHYVLDLWVRDEAGGEVHMQVLRLAEFRVFGPAGGAGLVAVDDAIEFAVLR